VPYRISVQFSCRDESGASFIVLGFLSANSMPYTAISRHLAPFSKFTLMAIAHECIFQSLTPSHKWASVRSSVVDSAIQKNLGL
jgi:hypothetical protein